MKNNTLKIKTLFIKKMLFSSLIQLFFIFLLIIIINTGLNRNELNTIADEVLIKDQYTADQIASYAILGSKYALALELHNLGDLKKLDSIYFSSSQFDASGFYDCKKISSDHFRVCKKNDMTYIGISPIFFENAILGYVYTTKKYQTSFLGSLKYDLLLIASIIFAVFMFNFALMFLPIKRKLESSTKSLLDFISSESQTNALLSKIDIYEYKFIAQKFVNERNEISLLQNEKYFYTACRSIAEQVAHDIRSPLAALNTVITNLADLPENQRVLIKNAAKRITEIANNLLIKSRGSSINPTSTAQALSTSSELIFVVLQNIINEKNHEYFQANINLQFEASGDSHACFTYIELSSFKRVLSNLLNNSIEAMDANGTILIQLPCNAETLTLNIEDNGCGIPSEILPKIITHGFSFQKANGAGFGLSYAKNQIEKLNGSLFIESTLGVGTTVKIKLLRSLPPDWFCKNLKIDNKAVILILDDDPSIHNAWELKFSNISGILTHHFYNASAFSKDIIDALNPSIFLIDHELLANNCTGLDVIETFDIAEKSFLVTSSFEEMDIRARCSKLGVKIIPKAYVAYMPIINF